MAFNFQRPNLPYRGTSLQNDKRYQLLTPQQRGMRDISIDSDLNYIIDGMRALDAAISTIIFNGIVGADNPLNAGSLLTTDGANTLSWIKIQDSNILPGSISNLSLMPKTITAFQIMDGTITATQLAPNSVTTIKITDANVTLEKMAPNSVGNINILDLSITTSKIALANITTALIAPQNITTPLIALQNITTALIAPQNITTALIAPANITTPLIANGAITTALISAGAITLPLIAPGVLTPAASKADQIAGVSSTVYTNPSVQQNHPSALKFSCRFSSTASVNPPFEGYNVTSVTKNYDGNWTISLAVPFTTTTYPVNVTVSLNNGSVSMGFVRSQTTNSVTIGAAGITGNASNPDFITVTGWGTQ